VSLNSLADWVYDEFFYHGTNETEAAARDEYMSQFEGDEIDTDKIEEEFYDSYEGWEEEYSLEKDGMKLQLGYLGGAALVWVLESPHTTYSRPCSPCVPNAGDLDSLSDTGIECYTLPPEWFATEE
jgi:hypothetical protein